MKKFDEMTLAINDLQAELLQGSKRKEPNPLRVWNTEYLYLIEIML